MQSNSNERDADKFRAILVTPPWETASRERLERAPVEDFADAECHLHVLTTAEKIMDGISLMNGWGFSYRAAVTMVRPGEAIPLGDGFLSGVVASLLFGIRGTVPMLTEAAQQDELVFVARGEDPAVMARSIVSRCSYPPFLQIFGRGQEAGWTFIEPQ